MLVKKDTEKDIEKRFDMPNVVAAITAEHLVTKGDFQ